jgi:hypothetical protein
MKNKFGICILAAMMAVAWGPSIGAAQCVLSVLPADTTICRGEVFTMSVHVDSAAVNLMGYDVTVSFDGALLGVLDVVEGSLPDGSGYPTFFRWINEGEDDDFVFVNGSILGKTVDGPGVLFSILFEALQVGDVSVCVVESELRNGLNRSIIHTTECGVVTIEEPIGTVDSSWGTIKSLVE